MNLRFSLLSGVADLESFGSETIFSYRVGEFEVFVLVEATGQGFANVIQGATESQLQRYLPKGTYQSATNTFLVRTPERIFLIDTGFGDALFDRLKAVEVEPEHIDAILLTHLHNDHIGGLTQGTDALFPWSTLYMAEPEYKHWTVTNPDPGVMNTLAPYNARLMTFTPKPFGAERLNLFPGMSAIASFGHTPGHTMYLIESDGEALLFCGDLIHVQDIQFAFPELGVIFDVDPDAASANRDYVLEYCAETGIPIAGVHLRYPAIGTVQRDHGAFKFESF
ncbi:MBL fold metallo-hydrolase [Spirochaetia bacterium]|nr:MBL fold metallo-hydrolase [Spirochaetia bacterium]